MSVKLNKIYTKSGDDGTTGVVGGARYSKGSVLVESYGTCDELNSHLGLLRAMMANEETELSEGTVWLTRIQNRLFDIGSIMASPPDEARLETRLADLLKFDEQGREIALTQLEEQIDAWNQLIPEPESFVLPGGNLLNAQANVARTVCRRLERVVARRNDEFPLSPDVRAYINRLSDFLFVFSRWLTWKVGGVELYWKRGELL
jgi:cob(I)alamin adenosyltransferase